MTSPTELDDDEPSASTVDPTPWLRMPTADPIEVRDPLAEVLGTVPDGEPLTVTFAEVAKAAGHVCPAVSGAYRGTQLALAELYPDAYPVRSEIEVVVGATRDEPGFGPMANVVRHVTGAGDDTGFAGFNGYGGRDGLLRFEPLPGDGRTFEFARVDRDHTVRVTFDPSAAGVGPPDRQDPTTNMIPKLVRGDVTDAERQAFADAWHESVQEILDANPGTETPFRLSVE